MTLPDDLEEAVEKYAEAQNVPSCADGDRPGSLARVPTERGLLRAFQPLKTGTSGKQRPERCQQEP